ncbi:hypothetical protein [Actinophytocola sp.]|uniref:hypothetical protein n=1 Tax=Actinophytocola sp. TaxID=1872138 RepID=UPI002D7F68C8|nr:hypothetical protein [Actinophytocola sp.]
MGGSVTGSSRTPARLARRVVVVRRVGLADVTHLDPQAALLEFRADLDFGATAPFLGPVAWLLLGVGCFPRRDVTPAGR